MNSSPSESTTAAAIAGQKLFALICLVLALGTAALYWPITRHPFLEFDDPEYIVGNPHVIGGLSLTNAVWAFTTSEQANWHPLTWLSHQLDYAMFGGDPGGHHLVNLLFHVANTLLLFVFLRSATGALWRSALVAALFAWHPLHVESVAWASERKDVLSTFFWLLSLLTYLSYARGVPPGLVASPPRRASHPAVFYLAALLACACGLMSKPMVVTLPFALLLLDLWPLNRFASFPVSHAAAAGCPPVSTGRLIGEKVPFFVLVLAGSLTTYFVQSSSGAVARLPLAERVANAVLAYSQYTAKMFWPKDLAIIYPHPRHWPVGLALVASGMLLVWTFLCVWKWRQLPFLAVGWFWFLGTLVPTIGLIQVGAQSMADRYTYIPSIGFFIAVVWGASEYFLMRERGEFLLWVVGGAALLGCAVATVCQIALWRDSITLFRHAIDVTTDNYVAENCLGKAYEKIGDNAHAMVLYQLSVETEPRFPYSQFNLAMALLDDHKTTEGLRHLEIAAGMEPGDAVIQYDLGLYFSKHGSWTNSLTCYSNALSIRPDFAEAQLAMGGLLANLGRAAEAAPHLRKALLLDAKMLAAKTNLDRLLIAHPELR
jgi:tetratricopeptide (TPR) repeat protein